LLLSIYYFQFVAFTFDVRPYSMDVDWMAGLNNVDVIVGGDSHSNLAQEAGTPVGGAAAVLAGSKLRTIKGGNFFKWWVMGVGLELSVGRN